MHHHEFSIQLCLYKTIRIKRPMAHNTVWPFCSSLADLFPYNFLCKNFFLVPPFTFLAQWIIYRFFWGNIMPLNAHYFSIISYSKRLWPFFSKIPKDVNMVDLNELVQWFLRKCWKYEKVYRQQTDARHHFIIHHSKVQRMLITKYLNLNILFKIEDN